MLLVPWYVSRQMGHISNDWPAGIVRPLTLDCAFAFGKQHLTIIQMLAWYQNLSMFLKAFTTFNHAKLRLILVLGKYYAKKMRAVARSLEFREADALLGPSLRCKGAKFFGIRAPLSNNKDNDEQR